MSLAELFQENFAKYDELGASVCLWRDSQIVASLGDGFWDREKTTNWTTKTRVLIWSATKGLASTCLLHLCDREKIALSRPVAEFWPEYAENRKADTTLLHILSHQAGQPALRDRDISLLEHERVAEALARQEPFWKPGSAHGYHARTYGFLVDEIVRRISGIDVGAYFREVFATPLNLDLWIGLPPELAEEVAPIFAARRTRATSEEDPFYTELAQQDSLTFKAFSTPAGLMVPSVMNRAEIRTHVLPSFGGIGTAESLATFYYRTFCEPTFFSSERIADLSKTVASGVDRILRIPTAFAAGFMKDPISEAGQKIRSLLGPSPSAFGQPGAGGSLAFADPKNNVAFAYVMNQMEPGLFPNPKSLRLVRWAYGEDF
ncbi:MAG TPA: serine hydrolase domain-containing protein [Chthoniobacterales bacterium]|nr:serine hydrolase domain-containing protein [Chthoniobacterales bacterium]